MEDLDQIEILKRRKKISWVFFSLMIIILAIGISYYFLVYRFYQKTDNAYVKADVTWIVPRVSGEVVAVNVKDNQSVKHGQALVTLDKRDYEARYEQAQALLQAKQAGFAVQAENEKAAQANVQQAISSLDAAHADYQRLSADYQRYKALLADGVVTRQNFGAIQAQYVAAQASLQNAESAVQAAKAQSNSVQAGRKQLTADLENSKAALALYDLDRLSSTVVAPVNGTIGSLSVRVGSRVGAQTRLLAIIPDHSIYVEANFKETQIEKMHIGQTVSLKLDAYPDIEFTGRIESFSPASGAIFSMMPPDNATGNFNKVVQRVPVRISIQSRRYQDLIRPGLSVVATVDLRS